MKESHAEEKFVQSVVNLKRSEEIDREMKIYAEIEDDADGGYEYYEDEEALTDEDVSAAVEEYEAEQPEEVAEEESVEETAEASAEEGTAEEAESSEEESEE